MLFDAVGNSNGFTRKNGTKIGATHRVELRGNPFWLVFSGHKSRISADSAAITPEPSVLLLSPSGQMSGRVGANPDKTKYTVHV